MAEKLRLPEILYVRMEQDGDTEFPVASEELGDAIEDDGPTLVGTYKRISVDPMIKQIAKKGK